MQPIRHRGSSRGWAASTLAPGLGLLVWIACAAPRPPGKPMQTSCPPEIDLPSVEECSEEALKIKWDEQLRSCVLSQCGVIKVTCSEQTRLKCKELDKLRGGMTLAFTVRGLETAWYNPVNETHWCEVSSSHECVVKAVIHELAHSCGWEHGRNPSVPGNEESTPPCECSIDGNSATSCE